MEKQGSALNDVISKGLNSNEIRTNQNIPFVDEQVDLEHFGSNDDPLRPTRTKNRQNEMEKVQIHASDSTPIPKSPNTDTIVVDTPEGTLYITLDPDSSKSSRTIPSTKSIDVYKASPTTSKTNEVEETSIVIDKEKEDIENRSLALRRNSISMPTLQNLELEVLKQQYLNPQDECKPIWWKSTKRSSENRVKMTPTPTSPTKRVRKKPNLRIHIPSYPLDYVQMPQDLRHLILTANRTPNDIQFIDDDPETRFDTTRLTKPDEIRSVTPVLKINGQDRDTKEDESKDETKLAKKDLEVKEGEDYVVPRNPLRRSSISAPEGLNEYEIDALRKIHLANLGWNIPEHHQSSASGFSDGDNTADDDRVLSDDDRSKVPLRSPRRKSAAPRRLGRSEFSMDDDDYSPSNSVTSVNSLASLLREKLQSIPQKIRKKPSDYKLRAFVGLMFLAVVFFVGFAYVLYHQQALTKAYFDNVHFNEPKRLVRIFSQDDMEILKASLAVNLEGKSKSFPCLPEHRRNDGSICLEWLHTMRFYLKCLPHDPGVDNTTCYSVHWKALRSDITPTDCFDWSDSKVHWYGGGQSLNLTWPLDAGSIEFTPFVTGDMQKSQWGNVLTRYLINSKGAAIIIDEETPLYVAVNKGKKEICLKAKYDEFAFANKLTEFPEMRYNICTSRDMKSLHSSIHSHQRAPLWDGLKPADMQTLESLISEPVWQIAPRFKHELQAETISRYTEDVIDLGFLKQGHVLINEFWQNEIGDFTVDRSRFETLNITVDKLHRRGFKVVFTVQPFISTESGNFADCVQKRLLITERNSDKRIPALTRFKSLASAGVLDITNNRSVPWILDKLHAVIEEYHIDSFYFDLGTAYDIPHYYQCEKRLVNPDQYKTHFIKTFEKLLNIIGVSSTISLPRPPIFVSLPPFESSWEALRLVIPTMLTYGISGYPFIMPGAVGGDIYWPGSEQFLPSSKGSLDMNITNSTQDNGVVLPEKELYVRWLQMATFLPVMKFTHLPSKYNDERVLELAKNLTLLRQKVVTPLLLKYKREALEEGLPLIRPLWLISGGDATLMVQDEFALGDEIVVAPILHQGHTTREVYLPAGLWQDGIDGSLRKGNRWMHEYKVPMDKVAYFLRKPDDMRFR